MLKIAHVHQLKSISGLPAEVMNAIHEAVTILYKEYGEDRDVDKGYGGFVVVIEFKHELARLKKWHLDIENVITEYVDAIKCNDGQVFAISLILLGSDFDIVVVMPMELVEHTKMNNSARKKHRVSI